MKYIDEGKIYYTEILEICIRHDTGLQIIKILFHSIISILFHSIIVSNSDDDLLYKECMYLISHLSNDFLLNAGKERGSGTRQRC